MSKITRPLTDAEVRNAKPRERDYKLYVDKGLYLEVPVSGNKRWRAKYTFLGKENRLSLGIYPDVSLEQARGKLADMRNLISKGIDPSQVRKLNKAKMQADLRDFLAEKTEERLLVNKLLDFTREQTQKIINANNLIIECLFVLQLAKAYLKDMYIEVDDKNVLEEIKEYIKTTKVQK